MQGQIEARGPGKWSIKLYRGVHPITGKRIYNRHVFHGTIKEARRERTRLLRALDTNSYTEPSRLTLAEYLVSWLPSIKANISAQTFRWYSDAVERRIIPTLGHLQLARLRSADLKRVYAEWQETGRANGRGGLSGTTCLGLHRVLHKALHDAVRDGSLIVNPADQLDAPRKARREMRVLDAKQSMRLMELAKAEEMLRIPVLLALATGLRRGEILGLRWSDLDLSAGTLSVAQALHEIRGAALTFGPPKTPKSKRTLPLPPFAVAALREHKAIQSAHRLRLGSEYHSLDLVVATFDGSPWAPSALTVAFARFVKQSRLPQVRFHDLRHGHVSLLLHAGVPITTASARLGHSSPAMTMGTYAHLLEGAQDQAAEAIERVLGK